MSYRVVLTGKEQLTITDEQAEKLREVWKNKTVDTITIGHTTIAVSTIKGLFEIEKQTLVNQEASWKQQNAEWHQVCLAMSALSPEEKTERELTVRIIPALKLANGHGTDRYSDLYVKLWNELMDFFNGNLRVPRCPMKIWYPMIRDELNGKPFLTKFIEYISRNDQEIAKWCRFNGITINFDYQKILSYVEPEPEPELPLPEKGADDGQPTEDQVQSPVQEDAGRSGVPDDMGGESQSDGSGGADTGTS